MQFPGFTLRPALFWLCWLAASLPSQAADTVRAAGPPYEFRTASVDGTGKFYFGREVAQVMGHEAADWLERPEREAEEHGELLIELLQLKPGQTVADIGAGTGYYTRRMAVKVRPAGRVYAVDVQPEMLVLLTNRLAGSGLTNVVAVLGTERDPHLPKAALDMALMVDVYHEFSYPREMMGRIIDSLKPGGRVVFVEFRAEDPKVLIKPLHKMSEAQVKREMAPWPLKWIETNRSLPLQHVLVFEKAR